MFRAKIVDLAGPNMLKAAWWILGVMVSSVWQSTCRECTSAIRGTKSK
jgi:hypothetical protein